MTARNQNQSSPSLRNAVSSQPGGPVIQPLVSSGIKATQKTTERLTVAFQLLQSRYVFHEYKVWFASLYQVRKMIKQRYAIILVELRSLRVLFGERLTRRTAGK